MHDAHIHQDASVHPSATIGPGAVVGPRCSIAENVVIHPGAYVLRDATLAPAVVVYPGAVIGGDPQDLKFNPHHPAAVEIGPRTVIRENATVSLGSIDHEPTRVGADCMLMEGAHVGHNSQLADHVILANAAKLAGHVRVARACFISALSLVHQFVDIGELCMFQGFAGVGQHVPPYSLVAAGPNTGVVALNRVGLKRAGRFTPDDLAQLKQCHRLYYRQRSAPGWTHDDALAAIDALATTPAARHYHDFITNALALPAPRDRGVITGRARKTD